MNVCRAISPKDLYARRQGGEAVHLVDVRTPAEFEAVHAEFAKLAPLDSLDPAAIVAARNGWRGAPLYLICESGSRARAAAAKFQARGFANVVVVEGGTKAWEAAGLPVVRGRRTVSLERQVRIVAGLLVLAGTALGIAVSPWFLAIPAFVGAGLVFASVTDTCGMAQVLAKMPWNRAASEQSCRL